MDTFEKKRTLRHGLPEMSGTLWKEGRAFRRKKQFYCKLTGSVLYFFPPDDADLDDMEYRVSAKEAQINKCVRGSRAMEIMVQDQDLHSFSVFTSTPEEYAAWYSALFAASKQRVESFYEVGSTLGKGSYGIVRLARDRETGERVAIKMLEKTRMKESDYRLLKREMLIVHHLKHPRVVGTYDIFDTSDRLFIVLELMPGGMLYDVIGKQGTFRERDAALVVKDLCEALEYLHKHNIMHRDIKPENLLCKNGTAPFEVKLADFGFAKFIDSVEEYVLGSAVGTPYYVAPEVVKKQPYNTFCDMWSTGVILYNLLTGKQPFSGTKKHEVLTKIKNGEYSFPEEDFKHVSAEAKSLIRGLLQTDPGKRLSASGALHHPWIKTQLEANTASDSNSIEPDEQENLIQRVTTLSRTQQKENAKLRLAVAAVMSANRLAAGVQQDSGAEGMHGTAQAMMLASAPPQPASGASAPAPNASAAAPPRVQGQRAASTTGDDEQHRSPRQANAEKPHHHRHAVLQSIPEAVKLQKGSISARFTWMKK